jgi:hypothetical protein
LSLYAGNLSDMIGDLNDGIARVDTAREPVAERLWKLASNFFNCPLLPLAAIGGTILFGRRALLIPLAVAVGLTLSSDPYAYRAVYTVPYFVYGYAVAADAWSRVRPVHRLYGSPLVWLSALMLLWSGGISLCVRTAVAALEWKQRDPDLAFRLVDGLHAGPQTRVLLDSWSLYYAVRSRRWLYWGPYDQRPCEDVAQKLDYDYVIHDESSGLHPLDEILRESGYRRDVVHVGTREPSPFEFLTVATARYGPYVVYTSPLVVSRCGIEPSVEPNAALANPEAGGFVESNCRHVRALRRHSHLADGVIGKELQGSVHESAANAAATGGRVHADEANPPIDRAVQLAAYVAQWW